MSSRPRRRQIHIAHLFSCRFRVQPDRPKGKSVSNLIFPLLLRQVGQAELFEHGGRDGRADKFVKDGGKCGRRGELRPRSSFLLSPRWAFLKPSVPEVERAIHSTECNRVD
jgi:hypothetical protein